MDYIMLKEIIVTAAPIIISLLTLLFSLNINRKQKPLLELKKKLNEFLLQKEQEEAQTKYKADIRATLHKAEKNRKIKIWNDGLAEARNVQILLDETNEELTLLPQEVNSIFPINLESQQSVEINAKIYGSLSFKHTMTVIWEDDASLENKKEITLTS